jgi:hypothetical protein
VAILEADGWISASHRQLARRGQRSTTSHRCMGRSPAGILRVPRQLLPP